MNPSLRLDDEAVEELEVAAAWYERRIRVLAVAHNRRAPGYWRSRL